MNGQSDDPFQVTCDLLPKVLALGVDNAAVERLLFRLGHIEKEMVNHCKVLEAGNIAKLEVEIFKQIQNYRDLVDTFRELLTLLRQEQGIASPPNPQASGAE